MDGFTVWDDKLKEFAKDTYRFVIDISGNLYVGTKTVTLEHINVENRYSHFFGIGKTDIEGNKIYADSSIVEFGYTVGKAKHIGYFFYDEKMLCYKIKILSKKFRDIVFLFDGSMSDFKIIDTLQENKLGLYDAK